MYTLADGDAITVRLKIVVNRAKVRTDVEKTHRKPTEYSVDIDRFAASEQNV